MQSATMANGRVSKRRHEKPPNARDRAEFSKLINAAWQEQVESIIEVGILLETAKAELPHGEYQAMIKDDLPFGTSTARRLKTIADHDLIRAHGHVIPANWRTLYELTKLTTEQFEAGIKSGAINPKIQRKDAMALRGKISKEKNPTQFTRSKVIPLADSCAMAVRNLVVDAMRLAKTAEELTTLFVVLRDELTNLEGDVQRITQNGHIT
jgi:hypothetical protein